MAILTAILCRSSALSVTLTWLLILATTILLHVKLTHPDAVDYADILIPTFVLLSYWTLLCFYTVVLHAIDVYRLKVRWCGRYCRHYHYAPSPYCVAAASCHSHRCLVHLSFLSFSPPLSFILLLSSHPDRPPCLSQTYQIEIVMLYIVSFALFLVATVGLDGYLMDRGDAQLPGGMAVVYAALLVGAAFFFLGLVLNVNAAVSAMVARMGAEKPKPLSPSEVGGGWTVADSAFFDSSLLVGEIDINMKHGRAIGDKETTPAKHQNCSRAVMDVVFCHVLGIPRGNEEEEEERRRNEQV
jgi:hypothetical protein